VTLFINGQCPLSVKYLRSLKWSVGGKWPVVVNVYVDSIKNAPATTSNYTAHNLYNDFHYIQVLQYIRVKYLPNLQ